MGTWGAAVEGDGQRWVDGGDRHHARAVTEVGVGHIFWRLADLKSQHDPRQSLIPCLCEAGVSMLQQERTTVTIF